MIHSLVLNFHCRGTSKPFFSVRIVGACTRFVWNCACVPSSDHGDDDNDGRKNTWYLGLLLGKYFVFLLFKHAKFRYTI